MSTKKLPFHDVIFQLAEELYKKGSLSEARRKWYEKQCGRQMEPRDV